MGSVPDSCPWGPGGHLALSVCPVHPCLAPAPPLAACIHLGGQAACAALPCSAPSPPSAQTSPRCSRVAGASSSASMGCGTAGSLCRGWAGGPGHPLSLAGGWQHGRGPPALLWGPGSRRCRCCSVLSIGADPTRARAVPVSGCGCPSAALGAGGWVSLVVPAPGFEGFFWDFVGYFGGFGLTQVSGPLWLGGKI